MDIESWLNQINQELSLKNTPHFQRPFEALSRRSKETGTPIALSSLEAEFIFEWFKRNTKEGVHQVGSAYSSVYFFDGEFWSLDIPVFYGTVELNPFDSLCEMPMPIKNSLADHPQKSLEYARHWANCFDFGMGFNSVAKSTQFDMYGHELLNAGYEELSSSISLLSEIKPNSRAMINTRMALEMFFKAYAALKGQLTDKDARRIGHRLDLGLEKMIELSNLDYLLEIRSKLSIYPDISKRYVAQEASKPALWEAFQLAQMIGAIVLRQFSDYNILLDIEATIAANN